MTSWPYQFSVIIPTYARPHPLRDCLASLLGFDYPVGRFEVIVVDDGSPERLDPVVAPFRRRLNLSYLRQSNGGPASARNAGAAVARGRFLAFTDDDCRPAPDWLGKLEAGFAQTPDRLLGGRTLNDLPGNPYATTSQLILDAVYAHYNRRPEAARFFASNNMAMPAELFHQIGGFDTSFPKAAAEDRDLCDRWLHRGYQIRYAPKAVVRHAHPLTLRRFCRQHFNYGRGAWRYHQLRNQRGSGRVASDLEFHARLPELLQEPMAARRGWQAARVALLLALWQIANATGFFYEASRSWWARDKVRHPGKGRSLGAPVAGSP